MNNPLLVNGAFSLTNQQARLQGTVSSTIYFPYTLNFNANNSNAVYQENGKVMPLSISKQSYIIYK